MPTEVTLRIEKLVYGGDGLARSDGRVVLTPFVLPGELVQVGESRAKNDLSRGRVLDIIEPASTRVQPPCPYFGRCGGCHYQHAEDAYQTGQKVVILREVLRRVGQIDFTADIPVISGAPWGYRNRTQLHIHNGKVGYFAAGSHEVVAIDHCPISSPKLNDAIASLARDLPHHRFFDATVELFTNEVEIQVSILDKIPPSVLPLFVDLGGREPIEYAGFRVSKSSFFQVNRFLFDRLVPAAIGHARGGSAIDLYAGVGLFARTLSDRFDKVTAVEHAGSAFRDLQWNMGHAGPRVEALKTTAEEHLASLATAPDLILADPPRAGLGKVVVEQIRRLRPAQVTIVSCDPATLARDLAGLLGAGYRVVGMTLVDLFPQTFHLETVVQLTL